jgi:hypothetical protein
MYRGVIEVLKMNESPHMNQPDCDLGSMCGNRINPSEGLFARTTSSLYVDIVSASGMFVVALLRISSIVQKFVEFKS